MSCYEIFEKYTCVIGKADLAFYLLMGSVSLTVITVIVLCIATVRKQV